MSSQHTPSSSSQSEAGGVREGGHKISTESQSGSRMQDRRNDSLSLSVSVTDGRKTGRLSEDDDLSLNRGSVVQPFKHYPNNPAAAALSVAAVAARSSIPEDLVNADSKLATSDELAQLEADLAILAEDPPTENDEDEQDDKSEEDEEKSITVESMNLDASTRSLLIASLNRVGASNSIHASGELKELPHAPSPLSGVLAQQQHQTFQVRVGPTLTASVSFSNQMHGMNDSLTDKDGNQVRRFTAAPLLSPHVRDSNASSPEASVNVISGIPSGSGSGSIEVPSSKSTLKRSFGKKRTNSTGSALNSSSRRQSIKKTRHDFEFGDLLGEGSYGKVYHARLKSNNKEYAIKVIDRRQVLRNDKKRYIMREKQALTLINHPNLMKLYFAFQDETSLYFALEYCEGGELMRQIRDTGGCTLDQAKFYAAEIVLALEYLRSKQIIHRDLKPENVLLRANGHIVLTDFGTVRLVGEEPEANKVSGEIVGRKNSFVGSADYVCPEILENSPCGFASDLWSLGCLIYALLEGRSPFHTGGEYLIFQKILKMEFDFPPHFPAVAKDLVLKLLRKDPSERLGAPPKEIDEIKSHPFFSGIDFEAINNQEAPLKNVIVDHRISEVRISEVKISSSNSRKNQDGRNDGSGSDSKKLGAFKKWKRFLRTTEEILMAGFVQKRRGIFAKRRMLILSDYPRFVYVDAEKMEKKGEIAWSSTLYAEIKNKTTFYIHTETRSYYMQSEDISAREWVEEINKPKENFSAKVTAEKK